MATRDLDNFSSHPEPTKSLRDLIIPVIRNNSDLRGCITLGAVILTTAALIAGAQAPETFIKNREDGKRATSTQVSENAARNARIFASYEEAARIISSGQPMIVNGLYISKKPTIDPKTKRITFIPEKGAPFEVGPDMDFN